MPRQARIVIPGLPHHITQRGTNWLHGRSGHLWQGRFHSRPMGEGYTAAAMRYVERNPVPLCRNTQTGRPLATDSFLSKLEHTLGRRLRPLPVGRPRNTQEERKK